MTAMRKGALSVLRARWSFMTITGETIIEIWFSLGGTPNFQTKGSGKSGNRTFFILDRPCRRASLAPGLADQDSDTQGSTP